MRYLILCFFVLFAVGCEVEWRTCCYAPGDPTVNHLLDSGWGVLDNESGSICVYANRPGPFTCPAVKR